MGIPVYFKTLVSHYQDTILCKSKLNNIHSLFLDLNCLIHPCCHGLTDENEMIQKILFEITRLIDYTGVSELLYIAIDGIAPKGKMKQQRMRRHKSALERKYSKEKRWNTNAISPKAVLNTPQTVDNITFTWTSVDVTPANKPDWGIKTSGNAFSFTETLANPGLSNVTTINRTTTTESLVESVSVFTQ